MTRLKTHNARKFKILTGKSRSGGIYEKVSRRTLRKRKKDRLRERRAVDRAIAWLSVNPYYEDCSYMPIKLVSYERYRGGLDLDGENMMSGGVGSCSYFHCGVALLTEQEAMERVEYIKRYGVYPYQLKYIHKIDKSDIERYFTEYFALDKEWGFSGRYGVKFTDEGKRLVSEEYEFDVDQFV